MSIPARVRLPHLVLVTSCAAVVVGCVAAGSSGTMTHAAAAAPPPPVPAPLFIGAGDIAACNSGNDEATARLLDSFPDAAVFTVGDNAYPAGAAAEFRDCYGPSWGRHKARTWPVPGNHEYATPGASGYYEYFGARAGDPIKGYYSYDLGDWHLIALNSNIPMTAGAPQEQWLRADLAATRRACVLAYWHAPRFSSGPHGDALDTEPLWQALYEAGADVVINGHDHTYERFARQTPTGAADSVRGIREFVVGTGGAGHYGEAARKPNSEVFDGATFGVLKLVLAPAKYAWEFVPVAGGTFHDRGSGQCNPKPSRAGR